MRIAFTIFILLAIICSFAQKGSPDVKSKEGIVSKKLSASKSYDDFRLTFITAGMGSNMGSMMPTFNVSGRRFVYTYAQNSYWGKPDKKPDTLCAGSLRAASIDSIISLAATIKDTSVYEMSLTMSGVYQTLCVENNRKRLTFSLHNASHPVAKKIIAILNSNIPVQYRKLWLFEFDDK